MRITENFSRGALAVITLTFFLFAIALFTHGFTHDLLLEAAVFLVSVKLILMTYRNSIVARRLETKLDEISNRLDQLKSSQKS
jgi:Flp pilus assembly protein TadB